MGKTRSLFKKIIDTKGTFHAKMGSIKNRNGMCWRQNETPTLQSGLNLFTLTPSFLQLLYFISLAQQPTGQVAKHYDSETIQCAGTGRDNLCLDLFTAAKTLFWGTSLSTQNPFCPKVCSFWGIRETSLYARNVLFPQEQTEDSQLNISFARMFSPG